MICGSCLHDNALAAALKRLGHDVALIPTYTPIRTDETDVSIDKVFYGAVNVFLEQKVPLFDRVPSLLRRALDNRRLLSWASSLGSTIDARALGDLTLSVLQGENGRQREELEQLVAWLRDDFKPEIVQLTNSMLLGLARRIKEELRIPVLCAVQGEDIFIDDLLEPYRTRVRETLRERAADADGFVATSRFYADYMTGYLDVAPERMHHVRLGLNLEGHGGAAGPRGDGPFVVGYLARICPEKGLHVLLEAVRLLAGRAGNDALRLRVAGWLGERDRDYRDECMRKVESWGLDDVVEYRGEIDRDEKISFLHSLDVLSVPTVYREPKGLFVLEALANGVPVVQPRHGAFPEMIEATGGGLLVDPGAPEALADGLETLMKDPGKRELLGRQGREVVHREYTDTAMAEATVGIFREYLDGSRS